MLIYFQEYIKEKHHSISSFPLEIIPKTIKNKKFKYYKDLYRIELKIYYDNVRTKD